jgi:hypothetical protein
MATGQDSQWPLFAGLGPVDARPTVPRLARTFCEMVLRGWGLDSLAEDCRLIASELTSNIVRTATGPDGQPGGAGLLLVWLRLLSDRSRVRVEAWDNITLDRGVPVWRQAASTDESGRGLELVYKLSHDWGWDHLPAHNAKRVWAQLPR